jgi:hypothetical protein
MTRFSSNFSIPTMRISKRCSTRLSLSKTRLKRWRRMARGKQHFQDSPQEETSGHTSLSPGLSSETQVWLACLCMDNVLRSICNNRAFRHSARTYRFRCLSPRIIEPMCINRLTRACSMVLTQPLQPPRMHQLREVVMAEPISSVG